MTKTTTKATTKATEKKAVQDRTPAAIVKAAAKTAKASAKSAGKTAPKAAAKKVSSAAALKKASGEAAKRLALESHVEVIESASSRTRRNDEKLFTNRELSWLSFNERVLATACEPGQPLLEQLKFLAIFHTNLDEFFMVRVANILTQYRQRTPSSGPDKMTPAKQLEEIRSRVTTLLDRASDQWEKLVPALARRNVRITKFDDLTPSQQKYVIGLFRNELYPILTPQAIDPGHPFPALTNLSVNMIISLRGPSGELRHACLRLPSNLPRFLYLPRNVEKIDAVPIFPGANFKDGDILSLEDAIAEHLSFLFPGFRVTGTGVFRVTRNTDIEIEEDEADDLLEAVRTSVSKRRHGGIVRLEVSQDMSNELRDFLCDELKLKPNQVYRMRMPVGFSGFFDLYKADRPALKEAPFTAKVHRELADDADPFAAIAKHDILLHHPYETFDSVVDFIDRAAHDPHVLAIKQTLYRAGRNSPIVESLLEARRLGKQVTAVVELKARFDEESNIGWAQKLEKEGVNVVYGLVGLKIHAKLCLVIRVEGESCRTYAHIGTGNYNPGSAKMYGDLGLLTCRPDVCSDVADLFNVMTGYSIKKSYRKLLVSPVTSRSGILEGIQSQVRRQKKTGDGEIFLKCNQLVDTEMCQALYAASQAGVKIRCLVRGICVLRPGIPGVSDNIEVRSIVGRFLEHARVYAFGPNNRIGHRERSTYIGSADLMTRNLDRRIETLVPLEDPRLEEGVYERLLERQWRDTAGAWRLKADGSYERIKVARAQVFGSQEDMMEDGSLAVIPAPVYTEEQWAAEHPDAVKAVKSDDAENAK